MIRIATNAVDVEIAGWDLVDPTAKPEDDLVVTQRCRLCEWSYEDRYREQDDHDLDSAWLGGTIAGLKAVAHLRDVHGIIDAEDTAQ